MKQIYKLVIIVCLLLCAANAKADIYNSMKTFNSALLCLDSRYVDTVNVDALTETAIKAMLKELVGAKQVLHTTHYTLHTFEVLFLLRHMACHFASSRITLRDLADWALTCRALQDKVDWPLVERTVSDYGMTEFVSAINNIAHNRLGAQLKSQKVEESKSQKNALSLCHSVTLPLMERDMVYGSREADDKNADGLARLIWKHRRWNALAWKRKMVFNDSPSTLWFASLTSHAEKPRSILHKQ